MGHFANYSCILKYDLVTNRLYYDVVAQIETKKIQTSVLVQRVFEDGEYLERYLHLSSGGGYLVYLPNEYVPYYGIMEECELENVPSKANLWYEIDYSYDFIVDKKPEYKYLIDKISKITRNLNLDMLFALMRAYKEHPFETELLCKYGKFDIAISKRLYLLTPIKKKQIIDVIKNSDDIYNLTINDILRCIKLKCKTYREYCLKEQEESRKFREYLKEQKQTERYYNDYKKMCRTLNKKLDEVYWKYPKDLKARHDELMNAIKVKENAEINTKLKERVDKLGGSHVKVIRGYYAYIPSSVEDIEKQAKDLNQCLISCKYQEKMANGQCILVFIRKGDKSIATAEIDKQKKIKQFYCDEKDRDKCKPSAKIRKVLDEYLKDLRFKNN